jgi:hypothetical protein
MLVEHKNDIPQIYLKGKANLTILIHCVEAVHENFEMR